MEWIEAKKELPEIDKGVLITDGRNIVSAQRWKSYKDELEWGGHGFGGYEWEFEVDEDNVTHWMYLPDLPKEGEEK